FLALPLLATAGVALGGFGIDELAGSRRWGAGLPFATAFLPLAAVAFERTLRIAVPRPAARLAVVLGALTLVVAGWGHPRATAPIDDPIVTGVPPAHPPDGIPVTLDTTRADPLSTYGYPRGTAPSLRALAPGADRLPP